jgi:hypothetical protein
VNCPCPIISSAIAADSARLHASILNDVSCVWTLFLASVYAPSTRLHSEFFLYPSANAEVRRLSQGSSVHAKRNQSPWFLSRQPPKTPEKTHKLTKLPITRSRMTERTSCMIIIASLKIHPCRVARLQAR